MAKCKNCARLEHRTDWRKKGKYPWCQLLGDSPDLEFERYCGAFKKMSNADRIRSMKDEELAEALIFYDSEYEGYCHVFEPYLTHPVKEEAEKMCLEWLKSEVGCE